MTLLAVIILATTCSALTISVNNLVDIVIAVKQYFPSGCVCLVHDQGNGKYWDYE
jgi:hypothetical protein